MFRQSQHRRGIKLYAAQVPACCHDNTISLDDSCGLPTYCVYGTTSNMRTSQLLCEREALQPDHDSLHMMHAQKRQVHPLPRPRAWPGRSTRQRAEPRQGLDNDRLHARLPRATAGHKVFVGCAPVVAEMLSSCISAAGTSWLDSNDRHVEGTLSLHSAEPPLSGNLRGIQRSVLL